MNLTLTAGRRAAALGSATILLALINLALLLPRLELLAAAVPRSPHPAGYAFFILLLVPAFLAASYLAGWLMRRHGPAPRPARLLLDALPLATLPLIGLAPLLAGDPRRMLRLQGFLYLAALALRLGALLADARRVLACGQARERLGPAAVCFGLPLLIYLGLFFWTGTTSSTTGDEPYYLMVARSLARDGDLDLGNQFRREQYGSFYWRERLALQNMSRTPSGLQSRAYATLFPLLLAPASLLEARWGPTLVVILLSALLAAQVHLLALEECGDPRGAFFAWAAISFTLPVLAFSSQIYPETAAALAGVIAFRAALRGSGPGRGAATAAAGAVLLPALKARYLPVGLGTLGLLALRRGASRKVVLAMAAALAALALLLAADRYLLDGALFLARFHSPGLVFRLPKLVRFWPSASLGLLADREFGLAVHSPLYLLAPAGAWWAVRERGWRGAAPLLPMAAYLAILVGHFGHLWYGGFSQPSRYLVAILPLAAPYLAWALARCPRPAAAIFTAAGALWTLLLAFPYFLYAGLRYPRADGVGRLLGALFGGLVPEPGGILPSYLNQEALTAGGAILAALVLLLPSLAALAAARRRSSRPAAVALAAFALLALSRAGAPTRLLEAESLRHEGGKLYTGLVRGPVRVFDKPGRVEAEVRTRSQNLLLEVVAGARSPLERPRLLVSLDGHEAGGVRLQAQPGRYDRGRYRFTLSAPPGRHALSLRVDVPPGSNVYLDRLLLKEAGR